MAGQAPTRNVSAGQTVWPAIAASQVFAFLTIAASIVLALMVLAMRLQLTDGLATAITTLLAMGTVFILTPPLIRKMHAGGMVGLDVNKLGRAPIAELGGISALFAFSVSLSLVIGFQKLLGNVAEPPFLAAISVFFMAATIGLIDDISDLPQRLKAIAVAFAALPLMLVHVGPTVIGLPFGYQLAFLGDWRLVYWLILVPVGVTGVANAMNMSAGYNGLETGQIAIASLSLLIVSQIQGVPDVAMLVFGAIAGCAVGLYFFNRFPARLFIGDIGTLGLGAALAAGVILGHIEFYGVVAIAPAFYEAGAHAYFGFHKKNAERKSACHQPVILPDGRLRPPEGASRFTLAYWILSKHPMTEKNLVRVILVIYAAFGTAAVILSLL